jgi:surface antigen
VATILTSATLLTISLPAYAAEPPSVIAANTVAPAPAQTLIVPAASVAVSVVRDGYDVGAVEQIQATALNTVATPADDYPWPDAVPVQQGGKLSPLSYYYRECVDFVAFRLNRDVGTSGAPFAFTWSNLTPTGGDARAWAAAWDRNGWESSNVPVVGAVAWWSSNHVAYVQAVNGDGTVFIEEYNIGGRHVYGTRTIATDSVEKFLYPPT